MALHNQRKTLLVFTACGCRPGRRALRFGTTDHDPRQPRLDHRHRDSQRQHRDLPRQPRLDDRHGDNTGQPDHLPQLPRLDRGHERAMTATLIAVGLFLAPPTGWLLGAWLADLTYETS